MTTDLSQLTRDTLMSSGEHRLVRLRSLLESVKRAKAAELSPVEQSLPELAELLYDDHPVDCGEVALELFRYLHINEATLNHLVMLQRTKCNSLVVTAFGMSDSRQWSSDAHLMLAEALALEETASAAADVLYKHSLAINVALTLNSLENLALAGQMQSRSEAISKLISHTEGKHGAMACQCLKNILPRVDENLRGEIAAKLAWSHRRGLGLLSITANDKHPSVRLASAKALWRGYRIRGRRLLAALSEDDDLQVRMVASQALS